MKNPNKYIRSTYLTLLSSIGAPIFDKRLPPDLAIPNVYCLISAQTKYEKDRTKCDKNWRTSTQIDIYVRGARGFADGAIVDDLEEKITDIITPDVQYDIPLLPDFICYFTKLDITSDSPMETPTETILHRVLIFRHDIGQITN